MAVRHGLRERREELCLTREEVAHAVGVDPRTWGRWEDGESSPRLGRRPRIAAALKWTLTDVVAALNGQQPAQLNGHGVPKWLNHLASLEQGASQVWSYEPVVVNGLLQTAEYARAVEQADPMPRTDEAIARRVELRTARQQVLTRQPDPLKLHVVLDESVLHRVAGSADVMTRQLNHLVEMTQLPNITIQILPMTAGRFAAAFGAFHLFAKADAHDEPYMACVEDRAGAHYLDRGPDLDAHIVLFEHLADVSLSPDESIELIRQKSKELYE